MTECCAQASLTCIFLKPLRIPLVKNAVVDIVVVVLASVSKVAEAEESCCSSAAE